VDVEVVYHQAAQAGVRASWGQGFRAYTERNINARFGFSGKER